MKKLFIAVLVAALAVSVVAPATAKKKKKPKKPTPVELQFFLRSDEACEAPFLSLTDAEDGDCIYGDGMFADLYHEAGLLDMVSHYTAADGVPLVLDTSKHVTGTINIRGWNGTGVGAAQIDIALIANIAGEDVVLGEYSESYTAGPQEIKAIELDLELDPKYAGAAVDALTLDVYAHGNTIFGRGVEHDEPVSFIKVPALQK